MRGSAAASASEAAPAAFGTANKPAASRAALRKCFMESLSYVHAEGVGRNNRCETGSFRPLHIDAAYSANGQETQE
jgi:hypothetical protein